MGSIIYDFLNESFLFDPNLIADKYSSMSNDQLEEEVSRYREFALSKIQDLLNEMDPKKELRLFGSEDYFSIDHLKQTALYLDQIIIPDPIFPFCRQQSEAAKTMAQYLGMPKKEGFDRPGLAYATQLMKDLRPMVASDYLKFFPVNYYLEPEEQLIPLLFSECHFSDLLPPDILKTYHINAKVKTLKKSASGWIVEDGLKMGRGIAVQFKGETEKEIQIYHLFEPKLLKANDKERIAHFSLTLPDEAPPTGLFDAWVYQSVNKSARAHFEKLMKALRLSSEFHASYLTCSQFTHSLLQKEFGLFSLSSG